LDKGLSLGFCSPINEIPATEFDLYRDLVVKVELFQDLPDIPIYRIDRDFHYHGDLPVGILQANVSNDVLFAAG
jgi:hypothetical protein